ncbi:hypothetical protein [Nevskia soli]|uniref:hypothetical protein n=1 Tax=Nevskia soli TaxID=418856 RepID=UPI0004A76FC0|nr:hypothetical protein [Nevskia soli]
MSNPNDTTGNQTVRSSAQSVGGQSGVIPNFHHLASHGPLALESYIHLYLEGAAKSGLDTTSGKRRTA